MTDPATGDSMFTAISATDGEGVGGIRLVQAMFMCTLMELIAEVTLFC